MAAMGSGHVIVAFRRKCNPKSFHGQFDGHLAVACVQKYGRIHIVILKQFKGNAARVLVRVKEDKIFPGKQV